MAWCFQSHFILVSLSKTHSIDIFKWMFLSSSSFQNTNFSTLITWLLIKSHSNQHRENLHVFSCFSFKHQDNKIFSVFNMHAFIYWSEFPYPFISLYLHDNFVFFSFIVKIRTNFFYRSAWHFTKNELTHMLFHSVLECLQIFSLC